MFSVDRSFRIYTASCSSCMAAPNSGLLSVYMAPEVVPDNFISYIVFSSLKVSIYNILSSCI